MTRSENTVVANTGFRYLEVPADSCLTQQSIDALNRLFHLTTPVKLKNDMLNVFLLLLSHEPDIDNLQMLTDQYYALFKFLDEAESALKPSEL